MNNQDLRVIKTRSRIRSAFCEMLKKSPVEKISVTELAKEAQINKGTFYLHYQDIYALYNEIRNDFLQEMIRSMDYCPLLLTDPEKFLARFTENLRENADNIDFLWPKHDVFLFQPNLNDLIVQKIYDTCPVEKNARNDMALETIISSVFRLAFTYMEDEPKVTTEVLLTIIRAFFPSEPTGQDQ